MRIARIAAAAALAAGALPPAVVAQFARPLSGGPATEAPGTPAAAPEALRGPWSDRSLPAARRARAAVGAMTREEKLSLVFGYISTDLPSRGWAAPPEGRPCTAGYVPGVPRLGVPPQWQTDAGLGVATHRACPTLRGRTQLPSGLALAATWNPATAFAGGAMIGREARLSGHNVLLAGGVNLMREPRNGRNFEYAGEDPLLAGVMAGEAIRGVQSNRIISTVKHFAFNDQETNRFTVDALTDQAAARQSDLLAFQIAIERGRPGSVMCAYNRVDGAYACENGPLLNDVLKGAWRYPGYVMSDWGGTHSTVEAAKAGLDQQSGWPLDRSPYFKDALAEAVADGHVPDARLDDMAERILFALYDTGAADAPVQVQEDRLDLAAGARISRSAAAEGITLLRNERAALPLDRRVRSILVVGGHADVGVLSGGGSSQVFPVGGNAVPDHGPARMPWPMVYHPSSPLKALREATGARVTYLDGSDPAAAAAAATTADAVVVFATQWIGETLDLPDLSLPDGQDALIARVAAANPRTIVVLETAGPVLMPWLDRTAAVVEAWYPGTAGGEAIADVLTGRVDPSGHLPATFPASLDQLPRPVVDGDREHERAPATVDYRVEGAAVGYKWFDLKGRHPLFPFGHGLSYTEFAYRGLRAEPADGSVRVRFDVRNVGRRAGAAVPQVYVSGAGFEAPRRLAGWRRLPLGPGRRATAEIAIDPRLLAVFDAASGEWRIAAGDHVVTLARSAGDPVESVTVRLPGRSWRD